MTRPRWRKVMGDLGERRGRSLLTILALAAGVFEICALLDTYALLQPELTTMYGRTHPASATLVLDAVSDALVDSVRHVPGVASAEARPVILTRVRVGPDEWVPALFYVVRDFRDQQIDTFEPERGAWPPGDDDVLLERSALRVAKVAIDGRLTVKPAGGAERSLRVAGTVHAAGLAPAWMEHMVPGFVSWRSPLRGADRGESAQIRIVTTHPMDEGDIRETADSVKAMLEAQGHAVSRMVIPVPGRHPHADQMAAFLYLLLAFGIVSFALSAVLVATMVHSLMAEQVRQVGIMKAIGATTRQIAGLYLGQVAENSAGALSIGIPLGLVVGRAYAEFSAGILNANLTSRPFPMWVVVVVAVAGFAVPLLVALVPVYRASRITVREALSDEPDSRPFGTRRTDRWLARIPWIPRPLALSVRTTLLERGRLALTVAMLALGGAAFMSALNVSGAWTRGVDADFRVRCYDLTVLLAEPYPIAALDSMLAAIPDVAHAEYWPGASVYRIGANGVAGSTLSLVGPDPGSKLLDLPLSAGRWLRPGDSTGAVVNRVVATGTPVLGVGDSIRVRVRGRTLALAILGVAEELSPMPVIYAPRGTVLAATGGSSTEARSIRVVTRRHDDATQRSVARSIERLCAERGIDVTGTQRMREVRQGILDHLVIILAILTMAALVVVCVGGLGLTSAMMLSVIQRTREIGILGAIGATPRTIARHVWFEGVANAVLSWGLANLLAIPVSALLETATGNIFFKTPLAFYVSPSASAAWLALVLVLGSLSSFYPARRAARLTVREAMSRP